MKTFRDLQVGDLIFEIDHLNCTGRISKINEIHYFGYGDVYFYLNVILGNTLFPVVCIYSNEIDSTIKDSVGSIVFANESDFLKDIENENV